MGKAVIIQQNSTKCTIRIGKYWMIFEGFCTFSQKQEIAVIGTTKKGVIDNFWGRIWLSNAVLDIDNEKSRKMVVDKDLGTVFGLMREKLTGIFINNLPAKEAGLVAGIVLGDKENIFYEEKQKMINSGTVHIVVASGYNIMLVGGSVLSWLFWVAKRKKATVWAIGVMLFYALLSGGEPPVIRAVIMASVIYVGQAIGRLHKGWWTLLLAGWLMILIDPLMIESVSFLLSMSASVGLMIVEPMIRRKIESYENKWLSWLVTSGLTTSVATMLTTMPVLWGYFGRVSWMGLLSNSLVLPLIPVIMILGSATLVTGKLLILPLYGLAHWVIVVIETLGG